MVSVWMVLAAIATIGLSGLPGCFFPPRSRAGQRVTTGLLLLGSVTGLAGAGLALADAAAPALAADWLLPWGRFAVALDPLAVVFLFPVFVIPALGSIYGLGYWPHAAHPENGRRLGLFFGLLAGAMGLVVVARDGVLFLIAWEAMALSAYFAATAEDDNPEVVRAGRIYLIATHIGTLCLIALFSLWRRATGSFGLEPAPGLATETAGLLFGLGLVGFGFKAGLMPLHVWLPGAHANAPSHVSAVMSGVMLKMGVYGLVRLTALLPVPAAWWGAALMAVGAVSGVAALLYAIGQHDLKRMLAYSSIENIGIIALGLGLALLGRFHGRPDWILLGLGGALLHVWNHSLFKSLLFFNAGAIIHATHTREMDRLGGLARRMPWTAALFVTGAAAICALPPLNGFAGEWLLYLGLFRAAGAGTGPAFPAAALGAVALSLIGALAVACFVKALGVMFLGEPRNAHAGQAKDPSPALLAPMAVLAGSCAVLGLFPVLAAPLLERAAAAWSGTPAAPGALSGLAPLRGLAWTGLALLALAGLIRLALKRTPRASLVHQTGTWDCGYARPNARMQYTGSSFGDSLVGLGAFLLWPKRQRPAIHALFPRAAFFKRALPDAVLDRLVLPSFRFAGRHLPRLRLLQQGQTHLYVLYILLIMFTLLVWGDNR
jgi:hydrogenase-4 component B